MFQVRKKMMLLKFRKGTAYFGSYAFVVLLIILFIILAAVWSPLRDLIMEILTTIFGG